MKLLELSLVEITDRSNRTCLKLLSAQFYFIFSCGLFINIGVPVFILGEEIRCSVITNIACNASFTVIIIWISAIKTTINILGMLHLWIGQNYPPGSLPSLSCLFYYYLSQKGKIVYERKSV